MKKTFTLHSFLILFLIFAFSFNTLAQTPTDGDYRTIASGTWSGVATWQVRTAGNWAATAIAPALTATVYIQTGHTLTIDVATAACNDIHVHSSGVLAIGVNTIEVNGKLRAYTGAAVVAAGADGTFYSGQISTATVGAVSISSTAGTGKMKFVGATRILTNAGEWGNNPQAWDAEFAPTAGQTLTIQTGFKASNLTITTGTVTSSSADMRPDGGGAGLGTLTIKNGATLQFSNTTVNLKRIAAAGATSHFGTLTVEAGGTLDFSGSSNPAIGASVFAFNGTVKYSGAGAQTLAAKGGNSAGADPLTYTNLTLSNTGVKTTIGALITTVNGTLSLQGTATAALGAGSAIVYGISGSLEYAGSVIQTSNSVEFPVVSGPVNLIINNANGVVLNAPRSISGVLTFTTGKFALGNNQFSITNNISAAIVGHNTNSYVVTNGTGVLQRAIAATPTSYDFPIGNTFFYKLANINFTTAPLAVGTLSARWNVGYPGWPNLPPLVEPNGGTPINLISVAYNGSWFLEPDITLLAGSIYTGSFTGNGDNVVINYSQTVLVKRPTAGGDWTLDGTHVTTTGSNAVYTLSRTGMIGFSEFAVGGQLNVSLPINLNYLNGYKQNGSHNLTWKVTCTNNPSATMSLERSADNRNFTGINSIIADALRCEQPFSYTDNSPLAGTNYYRLKMTDANGKVSYSAAIAILNAATGFDIVGLLPNLVNNNAVLNVTAAQKTKMDVVVTDIAGKQVQKIAYNLIAGSNQFNINLSNLSAGTYQITGYTAEGKSRTVRFVKQ